VLVAAAVGVAVFLAPIWFGLPLDADATDTRLLLDSWR
jgi:dolichyl-phosphate-mannose--protein O-mannosyl transferase